MLRNLARSFSSAVFDYAPDPETIARDSIRYMKDCAAKA